MTAFAADRTGPCAATTPGHATVLADPRLWALIAVFAAIHAAMIALVPDTARKMQIGDRAGDRFRALSEILAADGLDGALRVIFKTGSVGDYILFLPAWSVGGHGAVIAQSLVLYALAAVALYSLVTRLHSRDAAGLATAVWIALPSTLFHPQALVTETICNPVLILLVRALVGAFDAARPAPWRLLLIAILTAILAFVRHIYLLLPFAVLLWLVVFRPGGIAITRRTGIGYVAVSLSLLLVWWAAIAAGSLRYEIGGSVGGLHSNLFLRAERMAYLGRIELPASYQARSAKAGEDVRSMPPTEFVSYAWSNPTLFARSAAADAFNMMVNPGVAMLAGRYLGLFDLGEKSHRDLNKWRETREKEGIVALARLLLETSPVGLAVNALGIVLWGIVLLGAAWGAVIWLADALREPALRWLFAGVPLYLIGLTSLTAGYTRWDHRSPLEFVIAFLFAVAVLDIRRRIAADGRWSRRGVV